MSFKIRFLLKTFWISTGGKTKIFSGQLVEKIWLSDSKGDPVEATPIDQFSDSGGGERNMREGGGWDCKSISQPGQDEQMWTDVSEGVKVVVVVIIVCFPIRDCLLPQ